MSSGDQLPKIVKNELLKSKTIQNTNSVMKLVVAQKIIQAHNGEIKFAEKPTIVTIKIPSITYLKENGFLDSYSKIIMPKSN